MHDFCFSPLYSGLLLLMSVVAWGMTGSTASLVAGGTSGIVIGVCAYISFNYWMSKKKKCLPTVFISLIVSFAISYKMALAVFKDPSTHILQGLLCISSVVMAAYYAWNILLFTPHPPSKVKPMDMQQLTADAAKYKEAKSAKA